MPICQTTDKPPIILNNREKNMISAFWYTLKSSHLEVSIHILKTICVSDSEFFAKPM